MARVSMLLFGREFWKGIINWKGLAEAGTISEEDLRLIHYMETVAHAVAVIDGWENSYILLRLRSITTFYC